MKTLDSPIITCGLCQHIGDVRDNDDLNNGYHCRRWAERGNDLPEEAAYLADFREFFDVFADLRACGYYEQRPFCSRDALALLQKIQDGGDRLEVRYLSDENALASQLDGRFIAWIEHDTRTPPSHETYRLLAVGKAELKRGSGA